MLKYLTLIVFFLFPYITRSQESKSNANEGMFYSTEFCFGAGVGNVRIDNSILDANYERTYGLKFLSAYKFASGLSVGATTMYDYFSESGFLLLGPDVRYFTSSADFSPFVAANLGYGVSIGNDNRDGGFYYYPSAGVRIDIDRQVDLILSIGFKSQRFTEYSQITLMENGESSTVSSSDDYSLRFFTLSAGVIF